MLRANSSNAALRRATAALALAALAGCGRSATSQSAEPTPGAADGRVGYVRMADLVKVHPLYTQLARLDDDLQALQLRSLGGNIARSGGDVAREEKALQHELDEAAAQTKKALAGKEQEYTRREQAAIAAALGAGAGAAGPGTGSIANGLAANARTQAQAVEQAAGRNLNAYRGELIKQDNDAVRSLQTSLGQRVRRQYDAAAERLQKGEADYALQLATEDSAERLSLRTKLSNLALDDEARAQVKGELDALDKKESDAVGALKNRDESKLVALRGTLHARAAGELATQASQIRHRTIAKIDERTADTRTSVIGQIGRLGGGSGGPVIPGGVSPDMKAKLGALHQKFQSDFNSDASKTIARFQRTRSDLTRRFQALEGVDTDAQAGASREMDSLQHERSDLYNQMVAQIGREVKVLAQARGINVVVSDIVAPAGGVDLTADAAKDIESLHE